MIRLTLPGDDALVPLQHRGGRANTNEELVAAARERMVEIKAKASGTGP